MCHEEKGNVNCVLIVWPLLKNSEIVFEKAFWMRRCEISEVIQ